MNPKITLLAAVLFSISSVAYPASENITIPEYRCEIPPGLAADIVLTEKDSSEGHHDGHAIYRRCHAEGWHGMMQHYMKKGNTRYSPEQGQEWEIMIFAREVGAAEAKIAILKMELTGSEREGNRELIRKLLRMRYQSEKAKTKSEPAGADQPATKPADKAPVKD